MHDFMSSAAAERQLASQCDNKPLPSFISMDATFYASAYTPFIVLLRNQWHCSATEVANAGSAAGRVMKSVVSHGRKGFPSSCAPIYTGNAACTEADQ